MFRWERLDHGSWLGVDGDHWYRVTDVTRTSVAIDTNGDPQDFTDLFRLDWDSRAIEQKLRDIAPELAPYLVGLDGLRLMKPSSAEELFFTFLCTPNNNMTRIVQMCRHLAAYGPAMAEIECRIVHRFPRAEVIASIPEQELRAKGFGYRAATIVGAAQALSKRDGNWLENLRNSPYESAHQALCEIKGIGPKLADCIALFGLHHTDSIPVDTHIWQAYTRLYRPEWKDKAITDSRYREAASDMRARFGGYGGWAQQYLFMDNMLNWRSRHKSERDSN